MKRPARSDSAVTTVDRTPRGGRDPPLSTVMTVSPLHPSHAPDWPGASPSRVPQGRSVSHQSRLAFLDQLPLVRSGFYPLCRVVGPPMPSTSSTSPWLTDLYRSVTRGCWPMPIAFVEPSVIPDGCHRRRRVRHVIPPTSRPGPHDVSCADARSMYSMTKGVERRIQRGSRDLLMVTAASMTAGQELSRGLGGYTRPNEEFPCDLPHDNDKADEIGGSDKRCLV